MATRIAVRANRNSPAAIHGDVTLIERLTFSLIVLCTCGCSDGRTGGREFQTSPRPGYRGLSSDGRARWQAADATGDPIAGRQADRP